MTSPRSVPFILASGSPRRRKLLRAVVPRFRVIKSDVPEPLPRPGVSLTAYVQDLARKKALAVARPLKRGLVLGADTIVVRRGIVYGKPRRRSDARRTLAALGGKWHDVVTGVALVACPGRRVWTGLAKTRVKLRSLTPDQIHRLSRRHHDKAGAYAAQAKGNPYVDRYIGDFDNVVGLPVRVVRTLIRKAQRAGKGVPA